MTIIPGHFLYSNSLSRRCDRRNRRGKKRRKFETLCDPGEHLVRRGNTQYCRIGRIGNAKSGIEFFRETKPVRRRRRVRRVATAVGLAGATAVALGYAEKKRERERREREAEWDRVNRRMYNQGIKDIFSRL